MKLLDYKEKKKGRTWAEIAGLFSLDSNGEEIGPLKVRRWALQGADINKVRGEWVITRSRELARGKQ